MKKCKSCQSEIDSKASKCPHCQADQRGWFRKHPILTVILVVILIGIIGSASGGNKGNSSVNQNGNKTVGSETKVAPTPMVITARQLADDFDANQVSAEAKWNGKLVEFSAKISNITDSGLSFSNIASKDFSMAQISCQVTDKQQLMTLTNGKTIKVRGIIGKQMIGVIDMSECEVVK